MVCKALGLEAFESSKGCAGALCPPAWPAGVWCRAVSRHQQWVTPAPRDVV